jgi:hypothetical protein
MSEYQPIGKQCQYCGLTMARHIEKYLGEIPYKINSDDKYLDGVEQVKNTILQTTPDPITKTPKCTPFNNQFLKVIQFNMFILILFQKNMILENPDLL